MPPKCKFQEGEKVLCFHGPLIYEAKCLKSSITKEKQIKYLIHYAGWNKKYTRPYRATVASSWDEWVPESRVLKYNESNVQKQREVQRAHSNQQPAHRNKKSATAAKSQTRRSDGAREKEPDGRSSTPVGPGERPVGRLGKTPVGASAPSSSQDGNLDAARKKRSGRLETTGDSDEYLAKVEVKIKMSDDLKILLVDECEAVTKQNRFPSLPMRFTVDKILNDYVESKGGGYGKHSSDDCSRESALEVTKGIREYFNIAFSLQLLYGCERNQYEEVVNENPDSLPSQLYGAFYLLRLFVKLGGMLSYTTLDERSVQMLLAHFQDFLQYMQTNSAALFDLEDYVEIVS